MAKPQDKSPYKLSPSKFLFGYERCKRCFYLDIRKGLTQPGTFPSIFSKYDIIHKNSTTGMRTEDICIDIPKGIFFEGPGSKTLESVDIKCEDGNAGYISGKGDAFLKLDDGSYAVIDFKTTAMSSDKARDYSTQLHAYKYALENNREGKPHLSPITKLGIIVFEPDIHEKMIKTSESSLGIIHKTQWFEIPIDEDNFVSYVKKVVKLLSSQDIPHSAESCQFCDYRKNDF